MANKTINKFRWISLILAVGLPFIAWGDLYSWNLVNIGIYQLFGLLGVMAWLIMATHFYVYSFKILLKNPNNNSVMYSRFSSSLVLILILAHPLLIYFQQYRAGEGLPPQSVANYVGESLAIFVTLGVIALLLFLMYEIWEKFKDRFNLNKYMLPVLASQYLAMFLVYVHAFKVGVITNTGWFEYVWISSFILLLMTIPVVFGGLLKNSDRA